MMRNIFSIVVGLVAAIVIFLAAETANVRLHPVPGNLNFNDTAAVKAFYQQQPVSLWLLVLAGWAVGSCVCGFLIKIIGRTNNRRPAIIASAVLTLSAIANFYALPHPLWMMIVGTIIFFPAVFLGYSLRSFPVEK
jgi:hypothetical protein